MGFIQDVVEKAENIISSDEEKKEDDWAKRAAGKVKKKVEEKPKKDNIVVEVPEKKKEETKKGEAGRVEVSEPSGGGGQPRRETVSADTGGGEFKETVAMEQQKKKIEGEKKKQKSKRKEARKRLKEVKGKLGKLKGRPYSMEVQEAVSKLKERKGELKGFLSQSKKYESYLEKKKKNIGKDKYKAIGGERGTTIVVPPDSDIKTTASVTASAVKKPPEPGKEKIFIPEKRKRKVSKETVRKFKKSGPLQQLGYQTHALFSPKGYEKISSFIEPTLMPKELARAKKRGLSLQELQTTEQLESVSKVIEESKDQEKILGATPAEWGYWGKSSVKNPVFEATLAAGTAVGISTIGATRLGGEILGSTIGKVGLGAMGIAGVGARGYEVKKLAEAGKKHEALGKAFMTGVDIAAALGAAKVQSSFQKPSTELSKVTERTAGFRKGQRAMVRTKAGSRVSPVEIKVSRRSLFLGKKITKTGRGYLDIGTKIKGKQFLGKGEFGYGFKKGPIVKGKKFWTAGKVLKTNKINQWRFSKLRTMELFKGKKPTISDSLIFSKKISKTPSVDLYRTGGVSGKTLTRGKTALKDWGKIPHTEFTGKTGDVSSFLGKGGTKSMVSLKGTFLDTGQVASAAARKGTTQGLSLMKSSVVSKTGQPKSLAKTAGILTAGVGKLTGRTKEVKATKKRAQPKLKEVTKGKAKPTIPKPKTTKIPKRKPEIRTTPTTSLQEAVGKKGKGKTVVTPSEDIKGVTKPTTDISQVVRPTQRKNIKPIIDVTEMTKLKSPGAFSTTTGFAPTISPPPPIISPTVGAMIPAFGTGKGKDVTKPTKKAYRPSVGGVLSGKKIKKKPKGKLTGFEFRFPLKKKKKKKRGKSDLDKMIKPSGEI